MLMRVFILLLLSVTALVPAAAAQTSATVSGIVQDSTGAVVPGVTVTARSGLTGLSRTAVTGPEGRYVLAQLPPGIYEIRADKAKAEQTYQKIINEFGNTEYGRLARGFLRRMASPLFQETKS